MELCASSISPKLKDVKASHEFYNKMGFGEFHFTIDQLLMVNDIPIL